MDGAAVDVSAEAVGVSLEAAQPSTSAPAAHPEDPEPQEEEDYDSDVVETAQWYARPKHLFVLTYAGKPVYSRHGDESLLSSKMGMLSGIISIVIDTKDSLQFFMADGIKYVFLVRGPIYLVMISRNEEHPWLIRAQLDYVYAHVIFSATSRIITLLNKSSSTDIRHFLDGHEPVIERLLVALDTQLTFMLSGFTCLPMAAQLRAAVTQAVVRCRPENTLYAVVFSENLIVTFLEKKAIPLEVDDLLLLVNWCNVKLAAAAASGVGGEGDGLQETICLPNLDTNGNVYAYTANLMSRLSVCWISTGDGLDHMTKKRTELIGSLSEAGIIDQLERCVGFTPVLPSSVVGAVGASVVEMAVDTSQPRPPTMAAAIVLPGAKVKGAPRVEQEEWDWMDSSSSLFSPIVAFAPWAGYSQDLWHCLFKSAPMEQIIASGYQRFASKEEKVRLFRWYQRLYAELLGLQNGAEQSIAAAVAAGRAGGVKPRTGGGMLEHWEVNANVAMLGWTTKNFDLYCVFSPLVTYERALEVAQFLIKTWLPREKENLFLLCENDW